MIEMTVISYLSARLSCHVGAEIPAKRPDRFVVVEKMGGERENFIDTATISFKSYAPTMLAAMELSKAVRDAVESMTDLDEICCCEYGGDFNDTDTASKQYCYQAVYNITYY